MKTLDQFSVRLVMQDVNDAIDTITVNRPNIALDDPHNGNLYEELARSLRILEQEAGALALVLTTAYGRAEPPVALGDTAYGGAEPPVEPPHDVLGDMAAILRQHGGRWELQAQARKRYMARWTPPRLAGFAGGQPVTCTGASLEEAAAAAVAAVARWTAPDGRFDG